MRRVARKWLLEKLGESALTMLSPNVKYYQAKLCADVRALERRVNAVAPRSQKSRLLIACATDLAALALPGAVFTKVIS